MSALESFPADMLHNMLGLLLLRVEQTAAAAYQTFSILCLIHGSMVVSPKI